MKIRVAQDGRASRTFIDPNALFAVLLGMSLAVTAWAQTPIPQRRGWEAHMLQQGARFCNQADIDAAIGSGGVITEGNVWYYDGARVYDQIAVYTGDPSWYTCAGYSNQAYRDWVLATTAGAQWPVGALGGWRVFPDGLLNDYRRTGDSNSRDAVIRLAQNSAFAGSGGAAPCITSRETAYIINAYLAAEDVGQPRDPLLATAVNYALGHIDQWFVSRTCPDVMPFMVGLTMEALINYYEKTGDVRIPPQIRITADGLWSTAWVPASSSFYYESRGDQTVGIADLSLLIAPAYAWLWQKTGVAKYLDRGDQVFAGGVLYANFWSGKQFSQNYRWSFDYVKWRSAKPNSLGVGSTGFLFSRVTGTFNGKITVTNTGGQAVAGNILVELLNLTPGVTLVNATGTSGGTPFIVVPGTGSLAPGQSVSATVQFRDPSNALINFAPVVY
jgi:hypothetical protein